MFTYTLDHFKSFWLIIDWLTDWLIDSSIKPQLIRAKFVRPDQEATMFRKFWARGGKMGGSDDSGEAGFYRTMLCITQTMLSQDVRPSVTRRYSVETAKIISKLFHPRVATPF